MAWDGRYEIERTLGEGGMGEVLLARDLASDGAPVALKVLQADFREVATPYFMREFVMQRGLSHPNIAQVHDFGFDHQAGSEVPYFAMQYVPGIPLAMVFDDNPPLEEIWRWTIEMLRALDLVHRAGFLHRDVKPGNILVDRRPGVQVAARLIDFGIAVSLASEPEEFFIGTPEYSAPERIACEALDPRSDLYSLGLILYELLEDAPPWLGEEPEELWVQRMRELPPTILRQGVPDGVKDLINDILAPKLEDRPPTAGHIIQRLCDVLGYDAPIEPAAAFRMRLRRVSILSPSYREAMSTEARILALRVPPGHDGARLIHELADGAAVRGTRVVRVALTGKGEQPLAELEPALAVFRRLRDKRNSGSGTILRGIAGAAVMLTRMHRPTVLCIEGLQRADEATLQLLNTIYTGAHNPYLNVIATLDANERPRAPKALDQLLSKEITRQIMLMPLASEDSCQFIHDALGGDVIDATVAAGLHAESHGSPARLMQLLTEAFERGDLAREPQGYAWVGLDALPDTERLRFVPFDRPMYEKLSILSGPLPADAVKRFLQAPDRYRDLIRSEVLRETASGWVAPAAGDHPFAACYETMPVERRQGLHFELAQAMVAVGDFPGRAALLADQLQQTARPAQAVPYLVAAAEDAVAYRRESHAIAALDRAGALIDADPSDDEALWHWRVKIRDAEIGLAREIGDAQRLGAAANALFLLGMDRAHVPTMERALIAKMDHAHGDGAWAKLVEHAEQLVLFQHGTNGGRAPALHRWASALHAWSRGELERAFELVEDGLTKVVGNDGETLLRLLVLRADMAVRSGVVAIAQRATGSLREAAQRLSNISAAARAGVLLAAHLRQQGDIAGALAEIQSVTAEIGARHRRGLNGMIELEFAECHLAVGRQGSARQHAERARELALRDNDALTAFAAQTVMAAAHQRDGELEKTLALLDDLVANPPPQALPPWRFQAAVWQLGARMANGESSVSVALEAEAIARAASGTHDNAWAMRAVALATQATLKDRRSVDALRFAEWLEDMAAVYPFGGVPKHTVDWLMACAHYQMRWFKSAGILSRRAMERLRDTAQNAVAPEHRTLWLRAPDNAIVGSAMFDGQADGKSAPPAVEEPSSEGPADTEIYGSRARTRSDQRDGDVSRAAARVAFASGESR